MKFAHLADCHIGGWREPKLKELNINAFLKAVEICLEQKVDFILISGDLFNSSLPSLDSLKTAVTKLKQLKDRNVSVYLVAGSHDYSPSGKTILDILEEAGLVVNVAKGFEKDGKLVLQFTRDGNTNAYIAGLPGRKGALEKNYYLALGEMEKVDGYKIFLFHTALTEFKPKEFEDIDSTPLSTLPKGFDYYAGGHVHYVFQKNEPGYGLIAFPGPLFPNNFRELEELARGGFYLIENGKLQWQPVQVINTFSVSVDCDNKTPEQVEQDFVSSMKNKEFNETLVTVRFCGTLKSGKPSDMNFKKMFEFLYQKSAYFVMKNTNKLFSKEFVETKVLHSSVDDIENKIISENVGQIKCFAADDEARLAKELMHILNKERDEGEKVADFEKRVVGDVSHLLNME